MEALFIENLAGTGRGLLTAVCGLAYLKILAEVPENS